jgi:hypothetical protein
MVFKINIFQHKSDCTDFHHSNNKMVIHATHYPPSFRELLFLSLHKHVLLQYEKSSIYIRVRHTFESKYTTTNVKT